MFLFLLLLLQVPRSQHGSLTQRVGTTDIAISYNRPFARGRQLFGSLGRWGRIWHPGADSVTTISFSKKVIIDGHPLAPGRYSLWTIPGAPAKPWTVIFNRGVGGWQTNYPGESQDALRITVTPGNRCALRDAHLLLPGGGRGLGNAAAAVGDGGRADEDQGYAVRVGKAFKQRLGYFLKMTAQNKRFGMVQ